MPPISGPAAEVDITLDLVRDLLRDQHPDLAERPLSPLAEGWDNAMFRLGQHFLVRLPRRRAAAALVEGEPEDLTAIVNNPVFQRYRSPGDPNTWQADLQRQVQRITANAAQITELAARITGRAETPEMTIEVGSQGRIDSLRFTDRVTRLRREQVGAAIIEVYTEAARDAERQLAEALAELGITPQE